MRFDMRAPGHESAELADLYEAAVAMSRWGEQNGAVQVIVSEHHGSQDGYLPSPLVLASAIAGATSTLGIQVAALIAPLHDPIRLAEDMAVLDILSRGRVSYVTAVGYVPSEYAMMGRAFKGRGKRLEAILTALQQAFTGEPFEHEGRAVQVRPRPFTPGGPLMFMGGNSRIAARRAARFGMGLLAQGGDPTLDVIYREACEEFGTTPGMCVIPPEGTAMSTFVARDPDRAWREIGPHMLHDAKAYASWMGDENVSATKSVSQSVEALRAENGNYRILTPEQAVAYVREHGPLMLQPLCGGAPPKLGWESLELVANEVLPALQKS